MKGYPLMPTFKCAIVLPLLCWFYFFIFGLVYLGVANNLNEVDLPFFF